MLLYSLIICYLTVAANTIFRDSALVVMIPYGLVTPILLTIPRLFEGRLKKSFSISPRWLTIVETLSFLVVLVNAPGSLLLHAAGIQYDRPLHFVCGILLTILLFAFLQPLFHKLTKRKAFAIITVISIAGEFLWELWQWSSDRFLGTKLFFDSVQPIAVDTTEDLIFGFLGIMIGLLILNYWYGYFSKIIPKK